MASETLLTEPLPEPTQAARVWSKLLRHRGAQAGAVLVMLVCLAACGAEWLAPYDPLDQVAARPFESPSYRHWLGSDGNGRDIFSRVIFGARMSLLAGLLSTTLALTVGATAGAIAGFCGGKIETVIMRLVDLALSFPSILIALLVWMALPAGTWAVILAVALINIPPFCRQIRASVVSLREADFILASRALGATTPGILWRGILPAIVSPLVVLATLGLGTAILEVAGLSFLGISGEIDVPEWGNMINEAKRNFHSAFWAALAPGVAISGTVLGFNLLGDGLRAALDPREIGRG